jgi:hypothetical protein
MELRGEAVKVEILHPAHGFESVVTQLVAWLDRVHGEAAVVLAPEQLADRATDRFQQ